ncbi:MAG: YdcH family protein [Maricaulaceae bacterium]
MQASAHVEQLTHKHATLDAQIQTEQKSPNVDALKISRLKKEKLHLKEQIESFRQ